MMMMMMINIRGKYRSRKEGGEYKQNKKNKNEKIQKNEDNKISIFSYRSKKENKGKTIFFLHTKK